MNQIQNTFDIVIPVGPNDIDQIKHQISYTKKNIIGYRNIYILSYDPTLRIEGCITISESIFPFSMKTVEFIHGTLTRNGWYLQQLLKLYAGIVIPDILDRYLVIDSDTFFLKPTTFIKDNKCLYNVGREYHHPYFIHMKKLHHSLGRMNASYSGICHHMMIETKYVKELFNHIESQHQNEPFYNIFLKCVSDVNASGASEYEIYFNYMLKYNADKISIRPLNWKNIDIAPATYMPYDYVSYHWYMRK